MYYELTHTQQMILDKSQKLLVRIYFYNRFTKYLLLIFTESIVITTTSNFKEYEK